jgi:DNA-binding transcriptional regulator LsrR (DeoR family)
MSKAPKISDALMVEVCHRFLEAESPKKIAEWLNAEVDIEITREAIYPIIRHARHEGYFKLVPPEHMALAQRIADFYKAPIDRVHVSNVRGVLAREYVADRAAHKILELIEEIAAKKGKKPVRIGLGGGGTVRAISKHLSFYLKHKSVVRSLAIQTLTGGIDPTAALYAPNSFLGFFEGCVDEIEYQGLLAPPVVDAAPKSYEKITGRPGISESFATAGDVDIVITSLACASDEHGELRRLMQLAALSEEHGAETVTALEKAGWIGDCLYRPYSATEPIVTEHGVRAVSLFELEQLVDLSRMKDRYVFLVVTPCEQCRETKDAALAPLLNENLRIWNQLFIDLSTAEALVPTS